jgi:hypothetical protein
MADSQIEVSVLNESTGAMHNPPQQLDTVLMGLDPAAAASMTDIGPANTLIGVKPAAISPSPPSADPLRALPKVYRTPGGGSYRVPPPKDPPGPVKPEFGTKSDGELPADSGMAKTGPAPVEVGSGQSKVDGMAKTGPAPSGVGSDQPKADGGAAEAGPAPAGVGSDPQVAEAVDLKELMNNEKKSTNGELVIFFKRNRELDPLRVGPMGVNVFTYATNDTAVANDTIPRWMIMVLAFFPGVGNELFSKTHNQWKGVVSKITKAGNVDVTLMEALKDGVDEDVRKEAKETFKFIATMQACQTLKRKSYKPETDMRRSFEKFFIQVEKHIEELIAMYSLGEMAEWNAEGTD